MKHLDFEKPIFELEEKISQLRAASSDADVDINEEIARLNLKSQELTKSIFSKLTPWQVTQLARHPARPHALEYIHHIFTDFDELHGDRHYLDDAAVVGGIARLDDRPVMVIGHEKGKTTKEKLHRNFGMARPEGYRKALRFMKLAEKFSLPIITFIDTPGAYPGIGAEERNQSEAIAKNLFEMSTLRTPIICIVAGEGGSGGALALGVGDRTFMLEYSVYSVISPEGCASILWKSVEKAPEAAAAMKVTASQVKKTGLITDIIKEPMGGAHRNIPEVSANIKKVVLTHLKALDAMSMEDLLKARYDRLMQV